MITVYNKNVDQDVLNEVELVRPERARKYWCGIKHGDLVENIKNKLIDKNFTIDGEAYSLNNAKTDLVGGFDVSHPTINPGGGQTLSFGFSTSNAMMKKLQIYVGSKISVCTNGFVTGEVVMDRKHTINLDLLTALDEALVNYMEKATQIPVITKGLVEYELTQRQSDLILMHAGRSGVLPWSRIGQVEKEYRHPTYADHNVKSSWGLLNAATHIIKQSPAQLQMSQMNQIRAMLPTTTMS